MKLIIYFPRRFLIIFAFDRGGITTREENLNIFEGMQFLCLFASIWRKKSQKYKKCTKTAKELTKLPFFHFALELVEHTLTTSSFKILSMQQAGAFLYGKISNAKID
jgi:hypothetical protein